MQKVFLIVGAVGVSLMAVAPRIPKRKVVQMDRRKNINPYENDDYSAKGLLAEY